MFNPGKTINPTYKNKYFFVLAYAASMSDDPDQRITQKVIKNII
jgi:hypothetical protein